jgi:SAM-dependent methyltransferase
VEGDVLALPFADAAFTVTVSRASFHHMDDPAAALAEMRRVTAPGGRIVVSDLTPAPDKAAAFDAWEQRRDPSHVHAHPTEELRALGRGRRLEELYVHSSATELPLEAILATSFPPQGALDEVRAQAAADADESLDRLGLSARRSGGDLLVTYPMTTLVWRRP